MLKLPYEQILALISEKSGIPETELSSRIKAKMDQLAGLISKDGAAHIIANELGVDLNAEQIAVKLKDLRPGMRNVETAGKVISVGEEKSFARKDGSTGTVASIFIADDTARVRITLWNEQTAQAKDFSRDMLIKVKNPFIKESQFGLELHCNADTELIPNPSDVDIEVRAPDVSRKQISELQGGMANAEILGTIVQAFEPRYYEVCPDCGRRTKPRDGSFTCDSHGPITPSYAYLVNCILDDGTETIRAVFFRAQTDALLGLSSEQILAFKDAPASFEPVKEKLLGSIIKVSGRVSKNEMFDRLEFVAQAVDPGPDPEAELQRLSSSS